MTVTNDASHDRYLLEVDGEVAGELDYRIVGNDIHLTHTFVYPERREHGLASAFVTEVLDDIRAGSLRVVADCPYVAHWYTSHPDYEDLLAR